ncbi:MAG: hypothetical protein ACXW2C_10830 [Acidimicrobiia bacterium]
MTSIETFPVPEDPTLAAYATALNETGHGANIMDARWRVVFVTDELRLSLGEQFDAFARPLGEHRFGPSEVSRRTAIFSEDSMEATRRDFRHLGPFILLDGSSLTRISDPQRGR